MATVRFLSRLERPFLRSLIAATNASAFLLTYFLALGPFFCSTAPQAFFRPDRRFPTPSRAEAVKAGRRSAIAAHSVVSRPRLDSFEHGGRLDGYGLEERSVVEFFYLFSVCFGMLVVCGFSVNVHVACDDRISLYPAAPFRLATLLHAWTIAQVGRGSSLKRQTGWAKSANPHNSHTSDPPDAPEGASEL